MISINFIIQITILSLVYINIAYGRVVYLLAHAEKPGDGKLEEKNSSLLSVSSMEGLGYADDGLGATGMLRTSYMIDIFGRNAPYYRQPKKIITQHFILQNNGDFINNGNRGHHTSRRMYHQTYALALNLGIDPDAETCCGGSFIDQLSYIFSLPEEDDPVLVVDQHGVCDLFARAYAASYGKKSDFKGFGKEADKIWTLIDGEIKEEWYMCTPGIPGARCSDLSKQHAEKPSWVDSYHFPQTTPKDPLPQVVEYPSYIYTPGNIAGDIQWNYRKELRRRGVNIGEDCINEDLVRPGNNTDYN